MRPKFRRIELGDQFALVDLGTFVHRKADHAPGDLRADDHVVARDDPCQRNLAAVRRRRHVHNQRDDEQHADKYKKFRKFHRVPARL